VSDERRRTILTPEGVALDFTLAQVGDRLGAFLIDAVVIVVASAAVILLAGLSSLVARGVALAMGLLAFFVIRNLYFTLFECAWRGATPGKRAIGLRVIDAHGGMLTPEAVFARNLMREIELFLPLLAAVAPGALLPDAPSWLARLSLVWLFVLALLPLFNHDHLRVGDLVGGTVVIREPRSDLREDLSDTRETEAHADATFTSAQLDLYGIRELHVLEALLRQRHPNRAKLDAVARQIQSKIGWETSARIAIDSPRFLMTFYTAQRARLEQRLLLGDRREVKREGRLTRRL
jgi:uncharacterized RDD family membrane protein YckC